MGKLKIYLHLLKVVVLFVFCWEETFPV